MSRSARVTSIGVLQTMASSLQRFRGESASAVDDLDIEIHRALEWIHHDRKDYWALELRRSAENVTQARLQLQQAKMSRRMAGHEPSCIDEQRALERAKRRFETAEEKVKAVKHWESAMDRAVDEFQRSRIHFVTWLDTDMVSAVAALNRMSESLESYISLEAPADTGAPILGPTTASVENEETPPQASPENSPPPSDDKGAKP
jgi:hypothetical protein